MFNLTLSWDLFIIVFFAVIVTYTFIIGKKESMKIILSSYIAIVSVQGVGNVILRIGAEAGIQGPLIPGLPANFPLFSIFKLLLFIVLTIFLTIRSGFTFQYAKENAVLNTVITTLCGIATAGLLLSTLLTYITNVPILDASLPKLASLSPIIAQSALMQLLVLNQDLWFTFPAVVVIGAGIVSNPS